MAYEVDSRIPFGSFPPSPLQSALMAVGQRLPRTWAGRRAASMIRSFLKRLSEDPIDAVRLGSRMRLHPRGNATEKRLMTSPQFFDPVELVMLEHVLTPGFVFMDIGANAGAYTLFVAARVGRGGRIVAVEPHPAALRRLECNLALNGHDWVEVAPVALTDHNGSMELYINEQNIGTSSMHAGHRPDLAGSRINVPCQTLMGLIEARGLSHIDALKIDVEGAEDTILVPFFASAPRSLWPRLLVVEENPSAWKQDLVGTLARVGYTTAANTGANLVLVLTDA